MIDEEDNVTSPICAKPKMARKPSSEMTEKTYSGPSAKRQKLATNSTKKSSRDMPPEQFIRSVISVTT